mgnify:CR=1 FL=1
MGNFRNFIEPLHSFYAQKYYAINNSFNNGGDNGKNAAGQCNKLWAFGARSFTIWEAGAGGVTRVFDSGDDFEKRTQALGAVANFNAGHDNNTLDSRSPNKGPEPESVTLARFGTRTFAFIGLERIGGVMVYDVTDPARAGEIWLDGHDTTQPAATPTCLLKAIREATAHGEKVRAAYVPDAELGTRWFADHAIWVRDGQEFLPFGTPAGYRLNVPRRFKGHGALAGCH